MDIKSYVQYLTGGRYKALFDEDCCRAFEKVAASCGAVVSDETIQEIDLSSPLPRGDYSFKIDRKGGDRALAFFQEPVLRRLAGSSRAWAAVGEVCEQWCGEGSVLAEKISNIWLEMDYELCQRDVIEPCLFFDASRVGPGQDNRWVHETALPILLGKSRAGEIQAHLDFCIDTLGGRSRHLFQLGVMLGRRDQGVRVFTSEMTGIQVLEYLGELGWSGDTAGLSGWLEALSPYVARYILDFDVFPEGISNKVGINFGLRKNRDSDTDDFLAFLQAGGLCTGLKRLAIGDWLAEFPDFAAPIYNDISHFKLSYTGDENTSKVKAYLRQGSLPRRPFPAFARPRVMNIELTTRCPLRCPQCYCDLTRGQDVKLSIAKGFIEEAGSLGIPQVNLSGGETMLYPHLLELISCCRDNGVRANVALSGYGFDREVLRRMEAAGVGGIFISLNGSNEEINRHSRDGYDLAINALETLRDAGFPDYYINWVAHRSNVMDFPDLLSLAEAYQVPCIVVMAFKPDSRYALPSFPTREQLLFLADYIKRHQDGPVKIGVENCFSQLKAVIGQRFFVNLNQGIDRGCQAGRDAISVSVSGKLTPCRHLEYEEPYTSIAEYWSGSPVLRRLRDIEHDTRQPCRGCEYERYCLHCMAVNAKLKGELFKGNEYCELNRAAEPPS